MLGITGELADLAEASVIEATGVLVNARRHVARRGAGTSGRLAWAIDELQVMLGRATQVVAQTRTWLAGAIPASATRLVSLHDGMPARSSCTGATRRMLRCSPRPSGGSRRCSVEHHTWSPPTTATARLRWTRN